MRKIVFNTHDIFIIGLEFTRDEDSRLSNGDEIFAWNRWLPLLWS